MIQAPNQVVNQLDHIKQPKVLTRSKMKSKGKELDHKSCLKNTANLGARISPFF